MKNLMIQHVCLIDFARYIFAQPPDRLWHRGQHSSNCEIGCPMVHYGKEQLLIQEPFFCSNRGWFNMNCQLIAQCNHSIAPLYVVLKGGVADTYLVLQEKILNT